jgi:methionyl-tRNA formyltransferase
MRVRVLDVADAAGQARLKVAFLGSGAFGVPTLESLMREHDVRLIVSQPDRPAGRGMKLTPTPISAWAAEHAAGVPLHKPEDINTPDALAAVRELAGPGKVDAWVIIAFGQKLSVPLLEGVFACNLHASILPRWRGAAPINWSILAGDAVVGNSVITIAQRMDAGLVLATSGRPMNPRQTAGELHDALAADGPALVRSVLERVAGGQRAVGEANGGFGAVQDESLVTRARKLSRADAAIDVSQAAEMCRRRINGLSPWPGVDAVLRWPAAGGGEGKEASVAVKLLRAVVAGERAPAGVAPGVLFDPAAGLIACGEGTALQLLDIQAVGSRAMSWAEFANGRRPPKGCVVASGSAAGTA